MMLSRRRYQFVDMMVREMLYCGHGNDANSSDNENLSYQQCISQQINREIEHLSEKGPFSRPWTLTELFVESTIRSCKTCKRQEANQ